MHQVDHRVAEGAFGEGLRRFSEREHRIDPQLPVPSLAPEGEGILTASREGVLHAVGVEERVSVREDDPAALWGACRRSRLQLHWDGDERAVADLLDRWIAAAQADLVAEDAWETSLEVEVASRDSELVVPLLRRGFAPLGVTGIRLGGRGCSEQEARDELARAGIELRRATIEDAELLGEMDAELLTHDALHGAVELRAHAAATLQRGIEERLEIDPDWTWVIEQQGGAVGYLSLEVGRAHHRAKCAAGGAVAYIQAMYLRPTVRGGGVGEAVVNFAHARAKQAGFERMLLGYAALNPRSGPFWCRMGYRPLFTLWQRRPASAPQNLHLAHVS